MSTEIAHLRRRLVEFLIQCNTHYRSSSIDFVRVLSEIQLLVWGKYRFLQKKKKAEHWLLQPLTESNLQLPEWLLLQMHCSRGLSVQSLKSLGDKMITEQLFTVRDFMEAELVFLKVLKFEIGTLNIAYTLLDDLFLQFTEVAKVGELLNFEACMDMMDLLYEKEETSVLYHSSTSLAASILVSSYIVTMPKQQWEFPILPWGKHSAFSTKSILYLLLSM
ncbi:hypothetical protein Bca4012_013640 [Brassica carinata]